MDVYTDLSLYIRVLLWPLFKSILINLTSLMGIPNRVSTLTQNLHPKSTMGFIQVYKWKLYYTNCTPIVSKMFYKY